MRQPRLNDEDIRRLLSAVVDEPSIEHPDRRELRGAVFAEYLRHRKALSTSTGERPALEVVGGVGPTEMESRPHARWRIGLAAAAVTLAALASIAVVRPQIEVIDAAHDDVLPDRAEGSPEAASVEPGRYSISHIGGGIQLTIGSGVAVEGSGPGFVELTSADGNDATLIIMTGEGSLEDLLQSYSDAELVSLQRGAAFSSDELVTEFGVRPTNAALTVDCEQDPSCLALGRTRLQVGQTYQVRQLDGPEGRIVWTLFRTETHQPPFLAEANEILQSIEFTTSN